MQLNAEGRWETLPIPHAALVQYRAEYNAMAKARGEPRLSHEVSATGKIILTNDSKSTEPDWICAQRNEILDWFDAEIGGNIEDWRIGSIRARENEIYLDRVRSLFKSSHNISLEAAQKSTVEIREESRVIALQELRKALDLAGLDPGAIRIFKVSFFLIESGPESVYLKLQGHNLFKIEEFG